MSSTCIQDYGIDESEIVFNARLEFLPQSVVSALHRHGVALIREALSPAEILKHLTALKDWYAEQKQDVADGKVAVTQREYWAVHGICGFTLNAPVHTLLPLVGQSIFLDCARSYLNYPDAVVAPINHLLFRVKDEYAASLLIRDGTDYAFHQDHDLIPGVFPLNLWLPLSSVDARCTGLSFVFPYRETIHQLPFDVDAYIARNNGFIWTPEMQPGDMLLFHRYTIHGSFPQAEPLPRYSVEFRVGRSDSPLPSPPYKDALWVFAR